MELDSRFWNRVEKTDTCWYWTGRHDDSGYGYIQWQGRTWRAHRLSYTVHVGPIPARMVIDHLCRVRQCVRPEHLEAVTSRVNTLRGSVRMPPWRKDRTVCPWGHDLVEGRCPECAAAGQRQNWRWWET